MELQRVGRAPRVWCVLVNWNGRTDTLRCLESLVGQTYPALTVVVADNASEDGSAEAIRAAHPEVRVIETGSNLGFAGGTNVGIRAAAASGAEMVWLLNNDTWAPPDTLDKMVRCALSEERVGAVGTVLYRMDRPGEVQAWGGGEIRVELGYSRHFAGPEEMGPRSYLTFASVLIPVAVLREIGVLHAGYFMYYEDVDLSLRIREAGYKLVVAADTAVLHKEGGSSTRRSARTDRFVTASGLRFLDRRARWPMMSKLLLVGMKVANRVVRCEWGNVGAVLAALGEYRRGKGVRFRDGL